MNSKTRKTILRAAITLAVIISVWFAYHAGYHRGSKDALDWNFSAVIAGKVVPVGHGNSLLRSRLDLRPAQNINMVSEPIAIPVRQP
jgi:hypothetical protein